MRSPILYGTALAAAFALLPACRRAEPPKPAAHTQYTIEQFLKTKNIFGSAYSHDEKRVLYTSDESGSSTRSPSPLTAASRSS